MFPLMLSPPKHDSFPLLTSHPGQSPSFVPVLEYGKAKVLFDFTGQDDSELTLHTGEEVTLMDNYRYACARGRHLQRLKSL